MAGVRWFAAARASAAQREARAAKAANLRSGRPHCRLRCSRAGSASSGAYDAASAKASARLRLTPPSSGRRPASFAVWPPPLMSNVRGHCSTWRSANSSGKSRAACLPRSLAATMTSEATGASACLRAWLRSFGFRLSNYRSFHRLSSPRNPFSQQSLFVTEVCWCPSSPQPAFRWLGCHPRILSSSTLLQDHMRVQPTLQLRSSRLLASSTSQMNDNIDDPSCTQAGVGPRAPRQSPGARGRMTSNPSIEATANSRPRYGSWSFLPPRGLLSAAPHVER